VLLLTVIAAVLVYVFVHVLLFVDHHCAVQLLFNAVGAGAAGNVHSVSQLYIVTSLIACGSLNEVE
jgi:hypothetical protein